MAQKEATVYIVDVGRSMGEKRNGRDVTDLDWALQYVWDRITATIATERKTCHIGVIGLNTDDTKNELDDDSSYHHLSVFRELGQVLMPDFRELQEQLVVSNTDKGDPVSALVLAIQMITAHCKALKFIRRIILVTNGLSPMDTDDLSDITSKIKSDQMELLILGVDFDDPEYGFKEEDKPSLKAENESILKDLAEDCGGAFGTLAQAIDELDIPRIKAVKPIPSYKGFLTLGDTEKYDSAMAIDVERYPKVMVAKPPTASSFVIRGEATQVEPSANGDGDADGMSAVKRARTYQVVDEDAPGGKKEVSEEDLAKGYAYGSTAVHIAESDRAVTTFETKPGLSIIGFVAKEQYTRYMDMSRANMIIAQRTNPKAALALSSLIHALFELNSFAVARFVPKPDKAPVILLLCPSIESDLECLYDVELPFAEDVRQYRFPPLDRILTISGKTITQHRSLPNQDLQDAMSAYVDAMDLTSPIATAGLDDSEYASIDSTFSPLLHRINQVIRHRAINPTSPLPPVPEILTHFSHPPASLLSSAQDTLSSLIATSDVKKVPPKTRAKRGRAPPPAPMSGLDIDALLSSSSTPDVRKVKGRIDPRNAVPEFKQMFDLASRTGRDEEVTSCFDQMGTVIEGLVRDSVGDAGYGRAVEGMAALREAGEEMEFFDWWNGWVRGFKGKVLREELGVERREFWFLVRRMGLGLLSGGGASVGDEEGREFLRGMRV
ncbi:ATP-dependent DNA helicase II subunit 2-like protein [Elsinoe fawcettii]|nr:ATP-dependent DNA helicase II subunit 2-like protein [Elsinoe fawcettii]